MRRSSGPVLSFAVLFLAVCSFPPPLAAQRRLSNDPFSDDEIGTIGSHSFSVGGTVSDRQSGLRLGGVRVDLQSFTQGIAATAFTTTDGNFQFDNIRSGSYDLLFDRSGYAEAREHVDLNAPTFGLRVNLRRLESASDNSATISVRELSIPAKARDAMDKGLTLLFQKEDYPGSIKQFERAIKDFPGYYEAYANMGLAYMDLKDAAHAEEALRQSIVTSQEHYSDAFALLANLFSSQQRFSDAEPLARKAVDLDPNSWHAQSEMAHALLALKRPDDAEKYALAAIKIQPDNPVLWLLLADTHAELQNGPGVLDDLSHYLKLVPKGDLAEHIRQQRDELQQRLEKRQAATPADASSTPTPPAASSTPSSATSSGGSVSQVNP